MASLSAPLERAVSLSLRLNLTTFLILVGIIAAGLFLGVYNLHPYAWVPDQYDRLSDAKLIASGHLPQSRIYPPGGALVFALPVRLASDSLLTLQFVTIGFGIALAALGYVFMLDVSKDRLAATLFAGACTLSPMFLTIARSGALDIVIVFLITLAVFVLPRLRGSPVIWFAAYGALLALLFDIRQTNILLIVPLIVYWLALLRTGLDVRRIWAALITPGPLTAAAVFVAFVVASILTGRWYQTGSEGIFGLDQVLGNLSIFFRNGLIWPLTPLILPPAFVGARRLWQINRPLFAAIATLLIIWPALYAPFYFTSWRYAAPATLFIVFLASLGFAVLLQERGKGLSARSLRMGATACLTCLTLLLAFWSGVIVSGWQAKANESDAALAAEVGPVLENLGGQTLIVSSVARAFNSDEGSATFLDMMDLSLSTNDLDATAASSIRTIEDALVGDHDVYYLYSNFEADTKKFGRPSDDFGFYFGEIQRSFTVTEVYRTTSLHDGRLPWILYKVESRANR